jgi:hypothetical protein
MAAKYNPSPLTCVRISRVLNRLAAEPRHVVEQVALRIRYTERHRFFRVESQLRGQTAIRAQWIIGAWSREDTAHLEPRNHVLKGHQLVDPMFSPRPRPHRRSQDVPLHRADGPGPRRAS